MEPHQEANHNEDAGMLKGEHKEKHVSVGEFIKSAVYGGLDGIITIFSIVLSGVGSNSGVGVIVGLGISSLIADGLSMAVADFLATKSDDEYMKQEKIREREEIENDLEAEKREMVKIYTDMGEDITDAKEIVEILAGNKEGFLDVMMIEELGLSSDDENPFINSIVTFVSFCLFGFMPMLPYVIAKGGNLGESINYVYIAGALAAFFSFILGFSKSLIVLSKWYWSGLEAVLLAAISAGAAFGVGIGFG